MPSSNKHKRWPAWIRPKIRSPHRFAFARRASKRLYYTPNVPYVYVRGGGGSRITRVTTQYYVVQGDLCRMLKYYFHRPDYAGLGMSHSRISDDPPWKWYVLLSAQLMVKVLSSWLLMPITPFYMSRVTVTQQRGTVQCLARHARKWQKNRRHRTGAVCGICVHSRLLVHTGNAFKI